MELIGMMRIEGTKRFLNKLWENLDQIIDMKVDESNNNEFGNEIEKTQPNN